MNTLTIAAWLGTKIGPGGMKQATVARELGVRQSMVSRWLRGEAVPAPENCRRLARLFGEPETIVLAMAGHLSTAATPMPPRSVADLAAELAARLRDYGPSTNGPMIDNQSSGMLGGTHLRRVGASAIVSSSADLLALLARWSTTMTEGELGVLTVAGDWLLPAVADGRTILVAPAEPARDGSYVLAERDGHVCVARVTGDGPARQLSPIGGKPLPAGEGRVLAVIVHDFWQPET